MNYSFSTIYSSRTSEQHYKFYKQNIFLKTLSIHTTAEVQSKQLHIKKKKIRNHSTICCKTDEIVPHA